MARDKAQFQKGLSEPEVERLYGSEAACHEALHRWRWPAGFACPVCGGKIIPSDRAVYESRTNPSDIFPLWQCERCGYEQMSEKPKPQPKGKHG